MPSAPYPSHHHFYRWDSNHSRMGGLWHCFTHISGISQIYSGNSQEIWFIYGNRLKKSQEYVGFPSWGYPNSWMVCSGKILFFKKFGWELGVPPWLRKPPYGHGLKSGEQCSKPLLVDEFGEFHYLSIWRFPKSGWNPQIIQVMDDHSNPHIMRMGFNSGTPKIGWFRFQNVWLGLKIRSLWPQFSRTGGDIKRRIFSALEVRSVTHQWGIYCGHQWWGSNPQWSLKAVPFR